MSDGAEMRVGGMVCAAVLVVAFIVFIVGCTDAELEPIPEDPAPRDDELAVEGRICTPSPETLVYPMRVLFLVDTSVSMEETDPPDPETGVTGRERAVREVWERLLDQGRGSVRIGITRFASDAQPLTPRDNDGDTVAETYFTADRNELDQATEQLSVTERSTNYQNVLAEGYAEIRTELTRADQSSLPKSKYVVVFVSDGVPDRSTDASRGGSRSAILESVRSMKELADSYDVGSFSFNTAYLASGDAGQDDRASDLLRRMSEVGDGKFRNFANNEALNFLFTDLSILRRVFTLKSFGAMNLNTVQDREQVPEPIRALPDGRAVRSVDGGVDALVAGDAGADTDAGPAERLGLVTRKPRPNPFSWVDLDQSSTIECGEPMVDSDGDGLADLTERRIGTDPLDDDTDDDSLGDATEWKLRESGLDPTTPTDSQCFDANRCKDDDGDGECDCLNDRNDDGTCDCVDDADESCVAGTNRDCVDEDEDGWCDCRDRDGDGECDFADTDNDGIRDCEEILYGTAQRGQDSDADGLPDRAEIRFQTNPAEVDVRGNLDADRADNGTEVRANTNPRCDDSAYRAKAAYRYHVESKEKKEGRSCYDLGVENVTLVPTLVDDEGGTEADEGGEGEENENRYPGDGWNRILFYAGSVAVDDPDSYASYRLACVMANYHPEGDYKNPPSGRVQLASEDFVPAREFDPEEHCKWPEE